MGDERIAERKNENGADIDRQEIKAAPRSKTNRAEEGPGSAIDAERQSINERARSTGQKLTASVLAEMRDGEESAKIDERCHQRDPASNHLAAIPLSSAQA